MMSRCSRTSRCRISGTALTALTALVTACSRIGPDTSMPSTVMVGASGSLPETSTGASACAATAAESSTSTWFSSIHQVIARYIAPVSR